MQPDFKVVPKPVLGESLADAVIVFESIFIEPADPDLAALNIAIAQSPTDETLKLVKADRLDELDKSFLASMLRTSVAYDQITRQLYDSIMASFGIPAHLFTPNENANASPR